MLRPVLVATLALCVLAAPTGAAPARTATAPYTTASGVEPFLSGDTNINGTRYGSAVIFTRRGETRIEIVSATDANGLPVLFEITQDTDGDGARDWWSGVFCGRTPVPVRFKAQRRELVVLINVGQCGGGVSAPTTGTVTARLA